MNQQIKLTSSSLSPQNRIKKNMLNHHVSENRLSSIQEEPGHGRNTISMRQGFDDEVKESVDRSYLETNTFRSSHARNPPKKRKLFFEESLIDQQGTFTKEPRIELPTLKNLKIDIHPNMDPFRITMQRDHKFFHSPQCMRFSNSVSALNKFEQKGLPLSKDLFYSKDELRIIQDFRKQQEKAMKNDINYRTLKENKKEIIELYSDQKVYYKIAVNYRKFPLIMKVGIDRGTYECFISPTNPKPDKNSYDLYFNGDLNVIEYGTDVDIIYIMFSAVQMAHFSVIINFTQEEFDDKKKDFVSPLKIWLAKKEEKKKSKQKIYDLFKHDMNKDDIERMREEVDEIKAAHRKKMLKLSEGNNIIKRNMEVAVEYESYREKTNLRTKYMERVKVDRVKENKKDIDYQRSIRSLYNSVKTELMILEREWRNSEARKAQEKFRFCSKWMVTMAFSNLCANILERKRANIAMKILQQAKENNARRLQKLIRDRVLYRPIAVNFPQAGTVEMNEITYKFRISIYNGLNAAALVLRKNKTKRSETTLGRFFTELLPLYKLPIAADEYTIKVEKIQQKWKDRIEIKKARITLFIQYWDRYCLSLLNDPSKAKYRHTKAIDNITKSMVEKKANKYLLNKMRLYVKTSIKFAKALKGSTSSVHSSHQLLEEPQQSDRTFTTSSKPVLNVPNQSSRADVSKPAESRIMAASLTETKAEAMSANKFYMPTKEDIINIFDEILKEIEEEKKGKSMAGTTLKSITDNKIKTLTETKIKSQTDAS